MALSPYGPWRTVAVVTMRVVGAAGGLVIAAYGHPIIGAVTAVVLLGWSARLARPPFVFIVAQKQSNRMVTRSYVTLLRQLDQDGVKLLASLMVRRPWVYDGQMITPYQDSALVLTHTTLLQYRVHLTAGRPGPPELEASVPLASIKSIDVVTTADELSSALPALDGDELRGAVAELDRGPLWVIRCRDQLFHRERVLTPWKDTLLVSPALINGVTAQAAQEFYAVLQHAA